jgi:hydrogenase maturation factor HypF (carbamoyltransferase family)
MTDETFQALCNTYGFAPSRALRELIDCVRAQEIEACAQIVEKNAAACTGGLGLVLDANAMAIRARKEKV